jgi:chitin synthase
MPADTFSRLKFLRLHLTSPALCASHMRSAHSIFLPVLVGATPQEQDYFSPEDPSDYSLSASSGCYRLLSGPFSNDDIVMEVLAAMCTLGFKAKYISSIFTLLVVILLLSNIQFSAGVACDVSAYVANAHVLEQVARLPGVSY